MKLLTHNFLTCAIRSCKSGYPQKGYPLLVQEAELEQTEIEFQPLFIRNMLSRIEWPAFRTTAHTLGLNVPDVPGFGGDVDTHGDVEMSGGGHDQPDTSDVPRTESEGASALSSTVDANAAQEVEEEILKKLHTLLLETEIQSGKLICPTCGHEYGIKEGIANFLLPPHLV